MKGATGGYVVPFDVGISRDALAAQEVRWKEGDVFLPSGVRPHSFSAKPSTPTQYLTLCLRYSYLVRGLLLRVNGGATRAYSSAVGDGPRATLGKVFIHVTGSTFLRARDRHPSTFVIRHWRIIRYTVLSGIEDPSLMTRRSATPDLEPGLISL